jgi:biopolymer transport protein ExbD
MRSNRWGRDAHAKHRPERLKMTSMMDILTVLLLFLLKSFVVDAEVVTPPPDVELPGSSAEEAPESSLVIAISGDAIMLGDEPITTIGEVLSLDDLLIPALDARLDAAWQQMEEIAQKRGSESPEGKVTIQGDRAMEWQLLQRVMYTCNFCGFDRLSLAVIQES